jgi:hypothetical protein
MWIWQNRLYPLNNTTMLAYLLSVQRHMWCSSVSTTIIMLYYPSQMMLQIAEHCKIWRNMTTCLLRTAIQRQEDDRKVYRKQWVYIFKTTISQFFLLQSLLPFYWLSFLWKDWISFFLIVIIGSNIYVVLESVLILANFHFSETRFS